jgi:molybdate/tungstate transport system substrate-binding protein
LVVDGLSKPDIFVSAGTIPIMKLIDNKPPLAQWLINFASAEMVIAYSPNSHFYKDLEKARTGKYPGIKSFQRMVLSLKEQIPILIQKI